MTKELSSINSIETSTTQLEKQQHPFFFFFSNSVISDFSKNGYTDIKLSFSQQDFPGQRTLA